MDAPATPRASSRSRARVWRVALVASVLALTGAGFASWFDGSDSGKQGARDTKPVPVRVATSERGTLTLRVEYRGELVADAADIAAESAGRVIELEKNLGDAVEKGELLARIDAIQTERLLSEALAQVAVTEASQRSAEEELLAAKREAERAERLLAEQLLSAQEAEQFGSRVRILESSIQAISAQRDAARARASLYRTQVTEARIVAPFDGAVSERYLDEGANVQPGTPILRLVESGPLRVRFRASEKHVAKVAPGLPFTLMTLATGDRKVAGQVERVSAEVSRTDRTIAVEGVLSGPEPTLRPGMYATLVLDVGSLVDQVLLPAAALSTRLLDDGREQHAVYVVEQDLAHRRPVELLGTSEGRAAVKGVDAGVTVVSFGHEALKDGNPVKVVPPP